MIPLILLLSQLNPAPKLTLDLPVVRMGDLLPKVESQTSMHLKCSPEAREIALCIRVREAEPETFLKQLALATGGHWVNLKEERVFQMPDPDSIHPFTVASIATAKARIRNRTKPTKDLDQKTAEDAFLGLPNDPISNMKVGDRLVFSNEPTALQRPLPAALTPILAEDLFQATRDEFARAPSDEDMSPPEKPLENPKLTVILAITRGAPKRMGIKILQEPRNQEVVTYTSSTGDYQLSLDRDRVEEQDPSEANPFKIPPSAIAWADAVTGRKQALTPDQREALLHPEANDPLGFFVQEALRQWAATHTEQVVLAIPDPAFVVIGSYLAYRSMNAAEVDHLLDTTCKKIGSEPQWLTFAADVPAGGTLAVGEALRKAAPSGQITEDDLNLPLMQSTDDLTSQTFILMSLALGVHSSALSPSSFNGPDDSRLARRFYAALTPTQRQQAAKDGLTFGSLSGAAKARFVEMVYGADAQLFGPSGDPKMRAEWADPFAFADPISVEPTVELEEGISSSVMIRVNGSQQKAIQITSPNSDRQREYTDPANLGHLVQQAKAGDARASQDWQTSKFCLGTRETRWIIASLSKRVLVCSRFAEHPFQRQGKPGVYDELPADLRKLIEEPHPESDDDRMPPPPPPQVPSTR